MEKFKMSNLYLISTIIWMILFGILVIPFILGIRSLITYFTTEYIIDDKKVSVKTGLLTVNTAEMRYDKIESIAVNKPFWGLLFGYANVKINGSGGKSLIIRNIQNANKYKALLDGKIDN